jgi:Glycosyl transferase family 2
MAGHPDRTLKATAQSVCAVIVTYHPSARMLENNSQVRAQVQGLVVVDNGSSVEELDPLRAKTQSIGFQLIENGENLGIAEALNQGVRWTESQGYPWVILFDQDSKIIKASLVRYSRHGIRIPTAPIFPAARSPVLPVCCRCEPSISAII